MTSLAFGADCPSDTFAEALHQAGAVELAFANLDDAGFDSAAGAMSDSLPCVRTQLAPGDAAQLHRAMGLTAFVAGNPSNSRKSWAALRSLQPGWKPPASLMPDGHPIRDIWDAAEPTDAAGELGGAPEGGWVIDGARSTVAPQGRAFVVQGFDAQGGVAYTGYHRTIASVPDLAPPPLPVEPPGFPTVPVLMTAAGVGLAVGGGLMFASASADRRLARQPDTNYDQISELAKSANTKTGIGAALAVAGGATVGLAWTVAY